jgi:hypothetical protein
MKNAIIFSLLLFFSQMVSAQKNGVKIFGKVTDSLNRPIAGVKIVRDTWNVIHQTDSLGRYEFNLPNIDGNILEFVKNGIYLPYTWEQNQPFTDSIFELNIKLQPNKKFLAEVIITDDKEKRETGKISVDPKNALYIPSATGGVEALIKTMVGSNSELSSSYNVRGGNFDENLIYINDFEIFRPYLVSQGQQEGLSFINPELVKNISFFNGGFDAKYGDKMSSILDIQYKKPNKLTGSVYLSLLEQGVAFEGVNTKKNLGILVAGRNRNNQSVLASQATTGSYLPASSDLQSLIQWTINPKLQIEALGIYSVSKFDFFPESVQKTAAVFSPLYSSNLGLDVFFEGAEKDKYSTSFLGLSIIQKPSENLQYKWMLSRLQDKEQEQFDISGAYLFGERDFDNTSSTFGEIVNPLGAGSYQEYARNKLNIDVWSIGNRGNIRWKNQMISWGLQWDNTNISDQVKQFERKDSAGYSLPFTPGSLTLSSSIQSENKLEINKINGFIQTKYKWDNKNGSLTLQPGIRFQNNNLNREWLISPRVLASFKPEWKKDMVFRAAGGFYHQPPFYREFRKYDGTINKNILAQKSFQFTTGMDYLFTGVNGRKYRLSTEAYYKKLWDVVPYDINNVKITYLGQNNAKAYAKGIECRLFSELVKDAESWFSVGIMKTMEDIEGDSYQEYLNRNGEIINAQTADQQVTDSIKRNIGYLRRPTDRLITLGLFLQDYLASNKNFKVHINMIYGSNLPYNLPNNPKYRNALVLDPYIRVDLGLSALLLSPKKSRRSLSPFRSVENIWISLEVFNLINRANTISYQMIQDFSKSTYAIPNKLTPRLLNLKLLTRF